jgi:membrane protease YdiL (CAAX protease family)
MTSLLLNSKYELRSGWKFTAYAGFFLLIWVATGLALSYFVVPLAAEYLEDQLFVLALNAIALFVPAVAAMWLTVRFMDHRPLAAFGIGLLPGWKRDFVFGLALAAAMLAVLVAGCYALGYVSIHWSGNQVAAGVLLAVFGVLILSALNEELVFRGFPLQLLIDGLGEWPAIIVMSALFGAMHLTNPGASILGAVNTVIAGILLSLAYARTRSLWMPYGIHIGWNVGLGFVFGFRLSGLDLPSLWTTGIAGSDAILGGSYGPEGGLLATFVFATAALIVQRHGSINRNKAHPGGLPRGDHRDRAGNS